MIRIYGVFLIMGQFVKFTNTRLASLGKEGKIKLDGEGYATLVVGGLNVHNTANQFYTLDGAKELFESSSEFMRRVNRGSLNGELGHPRYDASMTEEQWVNRVYDVYEPNVCAHFKEIWIDEDKTINHDGQSVVPIMAKVCPAGAKAIALEKAFDTPSINVCFSVRGITEDFYNKGKVVRVLKNIITFDFVNEPGIPIAEKWYSPSLEQHFVVETLDEKLVSVNELEKVIAKRQKLGLAVESSTMTMEETLKAFKGVKQVNQPNYLKWK